MRDTHIKPGFLNAQHALRLTHCAPDNSGMNVGQNIRKRRKALGWKILDLANRVDSDVGNISRLERGVQGYSDDMLKKIATALGCTVADIFIDPDEESNVAPAALGTRRIPVISYVQAGKMTEAVDAYMVGDAHDWLLTDLDLSQHAFALKIKGDSMLPDFREGDTVIIDPHVQPLPGDFVVAKNGENEATFKKYRPRGHNNLGEAIFELTPLNEDYPSLRSDITPVKIIGTMVEHRRYRRKK